MEPEVLDLDLSVTDVSEAKWEELTKQLIGDELTGWTCLSSATSWSSCGNCTSCDSIVCRPP